MSTNNITYDLTSDKYLLHQPHRIISLDPEDVKILSFNEFACENKEELDSMYEDYLTNERESLLEGGNCMSYYETVTLIYETKNRESTIYSELVWIIPLA